MMHNRNGNFRYSLLWLLIAVPLIALAGSQNEAVEPVSNLSQNEITEADVSLPELIYDSSEHFSDIDSVNLDGLLERIGDSRVVLLGEASHGTREFYEMRARITRELIEKKGFNIIAVEADWPDASTIDYYIHGSGRISKTEPMYGSRPFSVFPEWMWRNYTIVSFTRWLKNYNFSVDAKDSVGFYGLDLYNLSGSIELVLNYFRQVNPKLAEFAFWSYSCLMPWQDDPGEYGRIMKSGRYRSCENDVFVVAEEFNRNRDFYRRLDKQRFFKVEQSIRLIKNGERYFRTMRDDDADTWNQRDKNMFDTLQAVLSHRGDNSKAVVWAHNIHIGDSRATDMSTRGEINLGQLVREAFADKAYSIGFGTDHGSVAAAPGWDRPVIIQQIPHSHPDSYEYLFHQVKADNFLLPLRQQKQEILRGKLQAERLQRAIGVAYDPNNELKKHYYTGSLPRQFDEYIWFDKTHAVRPLGKGY